MPLPDELKAHSDQIKDGNVNWPQREPNGPGDGGASQQVQLAMPAVIGLLGPSPTRGRLSDRRLMAEGVGFEPTVRLHAQQFSRLS